VNKEVKICGGGTEGEEYVACSAKVMPTDKWWRHFDKNKIFETIQEAIDSLV